ncbi:MAG TPA: hypothetical protein VF893_02080 [Candidatus Bathyarchaeia archaeon]
MAQRIKNGFKSLEQSVKNTYARVKLWPGFGVLALIYIASWFYLLVTWYFPWQESAEHGNWELAYPESIIIAFVTFSLIVLPGLFYVVWTNLLRKYVSLRN